MAAPFLWGTATSAFQIEGARSKDGKGDSIWDRFADDGHIPDSGLLGCDHYHRLNEDLDLLSDLGVNAYRFSIAWTRIIPEGKGPPIARGLEFYDRLVDGLLNKGITPFLTLYHWDLPAEIQDAGGWGDRETIEAFATYTSCLVEHFGDRVENWITINEPWVAAMLGHQDGVFAPGITDWSTALRAGHHLLLAHGRAVQLIREGVTNSKVGISLDCRPIRPSSSSAEDLEAAQHFDGYRNRWFFDPVFGLGYPADIVAIYQSRHRFPLDMIKPGDLDAISMPIDFLGVNYYTTIDVSEGGEESDAPEVAIGPDVPSGYTEMGWRIDPSGLERYLRYLDDRYQPASIILTENGASFSDGPNEHGFIADDRRIQYLKAHIDAVMRARASGIPVDGYFVWSLLDNLEWTLGYSQRFGLVWVDHRTGQRIPKKSFTWYADRITGNV